MHNLKQHWEYICNEYLKEFCEKHNYDYDPSMWVADDVGSIIMIGDMFVSMEDIRYDVENNIEEDKFEKWYWKAVDVFELTGKNYLNYRSFCKGAPDEWTEERMEKIRRAKKRLKEAKDNFQKLIDEYKDYHFPEF